MPKGVYASQDVRHTTQQTRNPSMTIYSDDNSAQWAITINGIIIYSSEEYV